MENGDFGGTLDASTSLSSLRAFFAAFFAFFCSSDGRYGGVDLAAFVRGFRRRYRRPLGPISHLIFTAYQRNTYEGSAEHVVQSFDRPD